MAYSVETDVGNKAAMGTPAQEEPKFQFKFLSSWLNKRSFLLTRLPSLVVAFCGSLNLSSSWGACHSVLLYKANTVLSKIQYHITAKVEMFAAMWYRLLDKTADIDRYIYENQVLWKRWAGRGFIWHFEVSHSTFSKCATDVKFRNGLH